MKSINFYIRMLVGALLVIAVAGAGGCDWLNHMGSSLRGQSNTIVISGSTSMEEMDNALKDAYEKSHPGIKVSIQAMGSTEGIMAVSEGIADIGATSRALKGEERERDSSLQETAVALDGIAIVVNPLNPLNAASRQEIAGIYGGRISNWSQMGGPDVAITVVRREDGSGTLGAFCELVMGQKEKDTVFARTAIIQNTTGGILQTVARDPGAIGFVSLASIDQSVKPLEIDGVTASEDNILNGSYPLQRPFIYVTRGKPSGLAGEFIEFALSPEGQKAIREARVIPVTDQSPGHTDSAP